MHGSSASAAPALFPAPPPHQNALSPTTRTALLRSTRKLGSVLGSTPLMLDAFSPASPSFPGTTKTPLRVLPIGPSTQRLNLSKRTHEADPVKKVLGETERANRQKRRQGSIFELPPWPATMTGEKPTLKIATTHLAAPLWHPSPLSSSSGSVSPSPLTALININFALASSSESSSDSERDTPITPASSKEQRGRSFGDRLRQRSRSRSQRRGGERAGLSSKGRKARPPPLVLELDMPAPPVAVKDGSYFSPITAVEKSRFSPDTPAHVLPHGLPYSIPPIETMPALPQDVMMDGMESIPLTPVPAAPTREPLSTISTNDMDIGTPSSPSFPMNTDTGRGRSTTTTAAAAARRKMAKLARTLGEPVPVELVFGASRSSFESDRSSIDDSRSRSPKKRTPLTGPLRNLYSPYTGRRSTSSSRSPVRAPFRPPGLGLGEDEKKGLAVNVLVSVTHTVSSPGPVAPTATTSRRRFAPKTVDIQDSELSVPTSPAPFAQIGRRRSRTLASALHDANLRLKEPPVHAVAKRPVVRSSREEARAAGIMGAQAMRSEEGLVSWVGEWNCEDMDAVRRGLRALPRA